jgi:hypothetical protein
MTQKVKPKAPFWRGYNACSEGYGPQANPYKRGTKDSCSWFTGHDIATSDMEVDDEGI